MDTPAVKTILTEADLLRLGAQRVRAAATLLENQQETLEGVDDV